METSCLIDPEQERLLSQFAAAALTTLQGNRRKFMVTQTQQGDSVIHPDLSGGSIRAYYGDIEALNRARLVALSFGSTGTPLFDVTLQGLAYHEKMTRETERSTPEADNVNSIEELRRQRFQYLHGAYEVSGGSSEEEFQQEELGRNLGFPADLSYKIVQYLAGEGLVKKAALGGYFVITHRGIREVEDALARPQQPTTHFLPADTTNIIHIHTMTNSTIQQASPHARQDVTHVPSGHDELRALMTELRNALEQLGLPDGAQGDLEADIQTVEAQLRSSQPKKMIIRESLASIRTILQGASGAVLANQFVERILPLLGG